MFANKPSEDKNICKNHSTCLKSETQPTKEHATDAAFKYNLSIDNIEKLIVLSSGQVGSCTLCFIDARKTRAGVITYTCKDGTNNIFSVPDFLVTGYELKKKIPMPWEF